MWCLLRDSLPRCSINLVKPKRSKRNREVYLVVIKRGPFSKITMDEIKHHQETTEYPGELVMKLNAYQEHLSSPPIRQRYLLIPQRDLCML